MEDIKPKILLAEDDEFIVCAYKEYLRQNGFEVIVASDGAETIDKIKAEKPDLVLLDLIMPVKNGFEVLEEIRKEKEADAIPIIVLSNLGQKSDIKQCRDLGANDYLVKTDTNLKKIVGKVKFYLERTKAPADKNNY